MPQAFINRIATANPPHDVHAAFLDFGRLMLREDRRRLTHVNTPIPANISAHVLGSGTAAAVPAIPVSWTLSKVKLLPEAEPNWTTS